MSLSTTKKDHAAVLHELADTAYFKRTVLVASAHNMPVESYPWRFSSVISVGSHMEEDPMVLYYNPNPPVEFFARGVNIDVAWLGGETITLHRQQLRDAPRRGDLRADPLEAPGADAVRAEEPAAPDLAQRGGPAMTRNDLNAAVAAGVLGSEERFRELLRSVVEVARAIFRARASSVLLLDEAANELVFEAVVGEGEESLLGPAVPRRHRRRGLGARHPDAARDRGRRAATRASPRTSPRTPATCRRG